MRTLNNCIDQTRNEPRAVLAEVVPAQVIEIVGPVGKVIFPKFAINSIKYLQIGN